MRSHIEIIKAHENNLKNVSVNIPRDKLTVITGVSGSGKSSLAYDVLFAEGQRRFLDTLSAYDRSRLPQMKRPGVQDIKGLSPIINIEQKKGVSNPRSTIGTITDTGSYLRLLYSVLGDAFCPYCERKIGIKSPEQIADEIMALPEGTIIEIRTILFKIYNENYQYLFDRMRGKGCRRFRINNKLYDTGEGLSLDEYHEYRIEPIIDRFTIRDNAARHVVEIIEKALNIGQNFMIVEIINSDSTEKTFGFSCPEHHTVCGEFAPWYFSPNTGSGCETCTGLGTYFRASPFLLVEDENRSIRQRALAHRICNVSQENRRHNNMNGIMMHSLACHYDFSLDIPFRDLPEAIKDIIFNGSGGEQIEIVIPPDAPVQEDRSKGKLLPWEGYIPKIDHWYTRIIKERTPSSYEEELYRKVMVEQTCPDCNGMKFGRHRNFIRIGGLTIHEARLLPIDDLLVFLENLMIPDGKRPVAAPVLEELTKRIKTMIKIGLGYLNLDRRTDSLSGGELQRTRLSAQISSQLMGLMYILDEPSIGLHPRDCTRLINVMKELRDLGNTVIVIEHDPDTISKADHIIEMGPGPGIHGGEVVEQGTYDDICRSTRSVTGSYLSGRQKIKIPSGRRQSKGRFLHIKGARENNLKNIDVELPLGLFVCITGVSGSGKSSLIHDILYKKLSSIFSDNRILPGDHDEIKGAEYIKGIKNIDQTAIGRSVRSIPATYIGFYDRIRNLFTDLDESKARGYTAGHFSFNRNEGRCHKCAGWGRMKTPMQYMADIETICPDCKGARYQKEILEIEYGNKSIAGVLDMSAEEALKFFSDDIYMVKYLKLMVDLGLGYLKIGQSSSTISGGEAQRIKLAKELSKENLDRDILYLLDEPTSGLHLADTEKLLDSIHRIVDKGNTVIVIEHNLEVIKTADYIIDLGPGGGKLGGSVVAQGTPEEISLVSESYTGQYLTRILH